MPKFPQKTVAALALTAIATFLLADRWAHAQADSPDRLTQQMEILTRTVGELARRVDSLEQKLDQIEGRQQAARRATESSRAAAQPPAASAGAPSQEKSQPVPQQSVSEQPVPSTPSASTVPKKVPIAAKAAPVEKEIAKFTPPENWARLKEGMTEAQVTELLGTPNTTFKVSGQTVWYYLYRNVGAGSVFFYDDGHVASKQKPPFGAWHW
jgi:hypothetical protein